MPAAAAAAALAARLVVGLDGPRLSAREAAWLACWRPAGVILFARNVVDLAQVRALGAAVRACLGPGAELAVDHEGGPISVLADAVGRPPAPWGLGLLADPDLTRRVHAETAGRLLTAGATRVLAPCADVLVEPRNPVIGVRAFGAAVERVAAQVAAAVTGLREGGLAVCLKHWPGHGGTTGDSHAAAVDTAAGAFDAPFAAGFAAGADAVMVGHLPDPRAPGSRGAPRPPATLDPGALARLRALSAGRAVQLYADDVTMGALGPTLAARGVASPPADAQGMFVPASLPVAWLAAVAAGGCDRLLCRGIPWDAFPVAGPAGGAAPAADRAGGGPERLPDAAVYREAWRRLAASIGGDPFPGETRRLLWLDTTAGDRWGEAAPAVARLRGRFAIGTGTEGVIGAPATALLVTSHRPLAPARLADLRRAGRLAPTGTCLALGHPALADDLRDGLPAGWRLVYAPELAAAFAAVLMGGAP
ncbi:MAG: glycoside hydrolase family 3 N-terminal domain-containing protein [Candidatus Krumholzibacteriia bacterium]